MIDPNLITTVRVGELPSNPISLTDNIPHEIGTELYQATVQELADVIGGYLGSLDGLSFNPTTVSDGQTLPITTKNEWILVGKGTFQNVGGGTSITTTEELNALTSNGVFWSLAVEIPINVELAGITQNIRGGYTQTTPSEDKLFNTFALYTKTTDLPVQNTLIEQLDFEANGTDNFIDIGTTFLVKSFFYSSVLQLKSDWVQSGSIITFTFTPDAGGGIKNLSFI